MKLKKVMTPEEQEEWDREIKKFIKECKLVPHEEMVRRFHYASDYITILPFKPRDPNAPKDVPYLIIHDDCPENIRKQVLEEWPDFVEYYKELKRS